VVLWVQAVRINPGTFTMASRGGFLGTEESLLAVGARFGLTTAAVAVNEAKQH